MPERLQFEEQVFNEVTLFIEPPVATALKFSSFSGWNGRFSTAVIDVAINEQIQKMLKAVLAERRPT